MYLYQIILHSCYWILSWTCPPRRLPAATIGTLPSTDLESTPASSTIAITLFHISYSSIISNGSLITMVMPAVYENIAMFLLAHLVSGREWDLKRLLQSLLSPQHVVYESHDLFLHSMLYSNKEIYVFFIKKALFPPSWNHINLGPLNYLHVFQQTCHRQNRIIMFECSTWRGLTINTKLMIYCKYSANSSKTSFLPSVSL